MTIRTPRLLLREHRDSDWPAVHAYASDPEVVRHVHFGPYTADQTRGFVRWSIQKTRELPRTHYLFAAVLEEEEQLIGWASLILRTNNFREADIGYAFNRRFWGRGYATEAGQALLHLGFERLALHRIVAECRPANTASAAVMRKLGMRCEAHLHENKWEKDTWQDTLVYAILYHEWAPARG